MSSLTWMARVVGGGAVIVLGVLAAVGLPFSLVEPVSQAEALATFQRSVAAGLERDAERLCALGSTLLPCRDELPVENPPWPDQRPEVVCTYRHHRSTETRVIVYRPRPHRSDDLSELTVGREGGRLRLTTPLWWPGALSVTPFGENGAGHNTQRAIAARVVDRCGGSLLS